MRPVIILKGQNHWQLWHRSRIRVSMNGLVLLNDGSIVSGHTYPVYYRSRGLSSHAGNELLQALKLSKCNSSQENAFQCICLHVCKGVRTPDLSTDGIYGNISPAVQTVEIFRVCEGLSSAGTGADIDRQKHSIMSHAEWDTFCRSPVHISPTSNERTLRMKLPSWNSGLPPGTAYVCIQMEILLSVYRLFSLVYTSFSAVAVYSRPCVIIRRTSSLSVSCANSFQVAPRLLPEPPSVV